MLAELKSETEAKKEPWQGLWLKATVRSFKKTRWGLR